MLISTQHQLLILYSAFVSIEKKWDKHEAVIQLFIEFKKADDSVRKKVLYNSIIKSVSPLNW
jgi:hypothetical protein